VAVVAAAVELRATVARVVPVAWEAVAEVGAVAAQPWAEPAALAAQAL